jgi:hypothetical protein
MEKNNTLKDKIIDKTAEMVDCVTKIGRQDYFEITIKHVNGELFTSMEFRDKDKVK